MRNTRAARTAPGPPAGGSGRSGSTTAVASTGVRIGGTGRDSPSRRFCGARAVPWPFPAPLRATRRASTSAGNTTTVKFVNARTVPSAPRSQRCSTATHPRASTARSHRRAVLSEPQPAAFEHLIEVGSDRSSPAAARRQTRTVPENAGWSAQRIDDACLVISEHSSAGPLPVLTFRNGLCGHRMVPHCKFVA